ncbi:MAG: hypothetical protein ABIJ48_02805 [Actinomycetota bacterium]
MPRSGGGYGPPAQPNAWLIGLAVAVALAAISIIAFGFLAPDDETAATTTTTTNGDGTTPTAGDGSTTTAGDGSTTTGDGSTTTTTGTDGTVTTTSIPDGGTPPIVAVGDPIPITELTLTKDDIGPLDFGDDGDQVLGRLVATFGEPTQDTGFIVGSGSWGECPGNAIRVVQWGPLNIVVNGEVGSSEFVSYRLDLRYGGITSPTTDMETKSGLRVMDTVGQMREIYAGFLIEFVVDTDAGLVFELRGQRGGDLLLWGPVESQNDDARVTGIYSPDSCDRTQE